MASEVDVSAPIAENIERGKYPVSVDDVGIDHVDHVRVGVGISRPDRCRAVFGLRGVAACLRPDVHIGVDRRSIG